MKMYQEKLNEIIIEKNSLLCIGLDVHPDKIPVYLKKEPDPVFAFNKAIIDATCDITAAYKPNLAFYEALGTCGWDSLKKTMAYMPENVLAIGDAKRGDIGSTAERYAEALFDLRFDAVTLSPYLGIDSIKPFIQHKDKGVFILCLTSNPSSCDFQYLEAEGKPLYLHVAEKVQSWNQNNNCGLVVGATHETEIRSIRRAASELPFLIPGIGAQGGNLQAAVEWGTNEIAANALINSSRGIIYASSDQNFALKAAEAANQLNYAINQERRKKGKYDSGSR